MTKQEEIREGMAGWLWDNRAGETTVQDWFDNWADLPKTRKNSFRKDASKLIKYLHSQGVVIQVEIPRHPSDRDYSDCGFIYEPLIKEE